jgi:hypothetical protein
MVIKAVIYKASDYDFKEELTFKNYNDMVKWMKQVYWRWIIRFPDGSIYKKLELEVYDDYVE